MPAVDAKRHSRDCQLRERSRILVYAPSSYPRAGDRIAVSHEELHGVGGVWGLDDRGVVEADGRQLAEVGSNRRRSAP